MLTLLQQGVRRTSRGRSPDFDGIEYPTLGLLLTEQLKRFNVQQGEADSSVKGRWHPLVLKWCISIMLKSKAAYEELRSAGFLALPHERTLQRYIHTVKGGMRAA